MDNIGLLDVDGHGYPNLALMKISAYWKSKGAHTELVQPCGCYDLVYKSKVFTFSPDNPVLYIASEEIRGGQGTGITRRSCPTR